MASELQECNVCCEAFNNTTHVAVACVCEFVACSACIKTYLVGISTDPNCMQCNKAWSDKFLAKVLGSTYMKGEYITHRKELLVQQQLARLPETMAAAEQYKRISVINTQIKQIQAEYKTYQKPTPSYSEQIAAIQRNYAALKMDTTCEEKQKQLAEEYDAQLAQLKQESNHALALQRERKIAIHQLQHDINVIENGGNPFGTEKKVEEARKFIMPCPNTDCRGYLSSQYKCELCEYHTCAKCFDLIGLHKETANHLCKLENIESAEFIRKQSKPCPCCGTRISKIDGCDQMWCTQCKKAFSWNTGTIITGTIHNPHFYQYQRTLGGGEMVRNPDDVVCGGLPTYRDINNKLTRLRDHASSGHNDLYNTLMNIHRLQGHFAGVEVAPLRQAVLAEQNYTTELVKYIVKELSREELASAIFRKDKRRKINIAVLYICELFIQIGTDMFQKIMLSEKNDNDFLDELNDYITEYDKLRNYCNEHFTEVSILYSVCVPIIKVDWSSDSTKYNSKGETDNYIIKRDEQRVIRTEERNKKREEAHKQFRERYEETLRLRTERRQQLAAANAI